jgi:superfamily II DNA/RNA helicase
VEDIRIVINLDYPSQTEDYVHRIGRTARSSAKGTAYSFFTRDHANQAQELIQLLKDSNQDVNEKLNEMSKGRYFSNASRGGGYRGGMLIKNSRILFSNGSLLSGAGGRGGGGGGGYMNGSRNDYNSTDRVRPSRFSDKRSRSRSPVRSTYGSSSRFDSRDASSAHSNNGGDYKRARTDSSRPPQVSLFSF